MSVRTGRAVVIGGGTMGAGIAQTFLDAGCRVTLVETSPEAADAARQRVEDGLSRRFRRAHAPLAAVWAAMHGLEVRVGLATAARAPAALVIEAVPEVLALKVDLLAQAEALFPGAVLASNTSSLSIDAMATTLTDPGRFVGMHFFNPVPRSDLVEVVLGTATRDETAEAARRWVEKLGKTAIVVRDSPGFATSRLGLAIGLEAIRMLQEGLASADDIDRGMVLGYKYPVGPLELTDIVGLDVRLAIAEHLARELGARFDPPQLLRDLVGAGKLGRKTGEGFYRWTADGWRAGQPPPASLAARAE